MWCHRTWVSPLAWICTVLLVGYVGWISLHDPESLWAPGHLSWYHTDIHECSQCHAPFAGATVAKCARCHAPTSFASTSEPSVAQFHVEAIETRRVCEECHTEHGGILAPITIGHLQSPHGEFIFRATSTRSCSDCHHASREKGRIGELMDNKTVRHLLEKGDGLHQRGHFAYCLKCHVGGQMDVEDDEEDQEAREEED